MLAKIRTGLQWFAAGIVFIVGMFAFWKSRPQPRQPLSIVPPPKGEPLPTEPKPLPKTRAERDAELRRLKLIK